MRTTEHIAIKLRFFEGHEATERVWMVWAASPIAELETEIERWKEPNYLGEIKEATKVAAKRSTLEQNSKASIQIEQDEASRRVVIKDTTYS